MMLMLNFTSALTIVSEERDYYNNRHEPLGNLPPSLKNLIGHLISDKRKKEYKGKRRERIDNKFINILTSTSIWSTKVIQKGKQRNYK